ncbi:MAG: uncharacterized protein KVP18_004581 [Porospora cf. gigantea A]|uniref:uncharacterized protein n=1 Tax=Porospora cf. gigantea A TaxID=2853593 RepID=UPI003559E145|nr:MAG: hypothetical protein KVP18_004581 [Porospora cf. gigantea A]
MFNSPFGEAPFAQFERKSGQENRPDALARNSLRQFPVKVGMVLKAVKEQSDSDTIDILGQRADYVTVVGWGSCLQSSGDESSLSFNIDDGTGVLFVSWNFTLQEMSSLSAFRLREVEAVREHVRRGQFLKVFGEISTFGQDVPTLKALSVFPLFSEPDIALHSMLVMHAIKRSKAGTSSPTTGKYPSTSAVANRLSHVASPVRPPPSQNPYHGSGNPYARAGPFPSDDPFSF